MAGTLSRENHRSKASCRPDVAPSNHEQKTPLASLSMENLPATVVLTDTDGKIEYINPCCAQTFGYQPSEMTGALLPSFWISSSDPWPVITKNLKRKGIWQGKIEQRDKDGRGHWELVSISAAADPHGTITRFVKAGQPTEPPETKIVERSGVERPYHQLFENAADGYFEVDLKGKFTFVNDAVCRFAQRSREEMLTLKYLDYMTPEEAQRTNDLYNHVYRTGKPSPLMEYEIIRKDGSVAVNQTVAVLLLGEKGEPVGFCGVVRDLTELRKTEQALKASELKYRTILANLEEGYYETDLKGNITAVNGAACRHFGRISSELIGMNYREFVAPGSAEKLFKTFNQVYESGQATNIVQCKLVNKDGTMRHHEISVSLMRDETGHPIGFFGLSRDRTEAIALEQALQESEESYRQVLEMAPDAICIIDNHSLRFIQVNKAFCRHLGLTTEEVIGRTSVELNILQNPEDDKRIHKLILEKGKIDGLEIGYRRKDGRIIDNLISARVIRFKGKDCTLFVATVITPLKEAHAALKESERSYRHILEMAPDAICIVDNSTAQFIQVNEAFCRHLGFLPEEVIGRTPKELNIYQDMEDHRRLVKQVARDGEVSGMEIGYQGKKGQKLDDLVSAKAIRFKNKECTLIVATVITPLKEAHAALAESEESYRRVMEMAPDAITISRIADGRYFEVNEAFCRQTGYSREEAIGRSVLDLNIYADPDDRKRVVEKLRKNGWVYQMEIRFRAKDGTELIDLFSARIIEFKGEECFLTVATVINPLVEAQQALSESEKRIREVMDAVPSAICLTTLDEGTYVEANRIFYERTGYTPEETIGRTSRDLNIYADPDDRLRFIEILKKEGAVDGFEIPVRYKNGTVSIQLWWARIIQYNGESHLLVAANPIDDLKAAQQALAESEESYRRIIELAPSMICITRVSDSRIVAVNKAFCQRTGYPTEAVIGHTPIELGLYTDPENRKRWMAMLKRDGKVQDLELNFLNREGTVQDDLFSAQYIRFKGEDCILTVITSITSLKEVQRALQEKEEGQRAILDTAPYAITIVNQSDLRYLQVNDSFHANTGYSSDEIIGRTSSEVDLFVDQDTHDKMEKELRSKGRIDGMEVRVRKKDGSVLESMISCRPFKFEGQPALLFISADITAFKQTQQALRESEAGYRSIIDSSPISISIIGSADGRYIEVNKAFCHHTGYRRDNLIGQSVRAMDLYADPSDHGKVIKALAKHGRIDNMEVAYKARDGKVMETLLSITPIRYSGRECVLSATVNIDAMKNAQRELDRYRQNLEQMVADRTRELEAAQQELVKQEKLAVLGQLTATVSHELRNPLGVIRSSNFYLQRKSQSSDEKQKKHFRRIEEQVTLCDTIVSDLLEYTRGRNISVIRQKLSDWMPELIEQLEESEGIKIRIETGNDLPAIPHDREKMRRVVINLLDNAIQAVKAKSNEFADYQPKVCVKTARDEGAVAIYITDNGIGMDIETSKRAFEPLFTTRARGTGIGLANVKKIVEEHKGRITLHSHPGQGTEMKITLPCRN